MTSAVRIRWMGSGPRRLRLVAAAHLVAAAALLAAAGCTSDDGDTPVADDGVAQACAPSCGPDRCGQEDGCGGRCVCEGDASCLSCPLRLVRGLAAGAAGTVTVTVESSAVAGAPLPRLAELVISADRPVELQQVVVGPALAAARKRLHRFTDTDLPWQVTAEGHVRLMVFSGATHDDVPPGRWLSLRFAVPGGGDQVTFRLVRRPDLLAPAAADGPLQASRYDSPLRIPVRAGGEP